MGFKITDYPAKTAFNDGDLYDVSSYDGVSAYTSEKMTFTQLKTQLNADLDTLYNADGSLTSARTVTLTSVNTLTFSGGLTTFKGEDATISNFSSIFQNSTGSNIGYFRNDGFFGVNGDKNNASDDNVVFTQYATGNTDILKLRAFDNTLIHDFNKGNYSYYNTSGTKVFQVHGTSPSYHNTGSSFVFGNTTSDNGNDTLVSVAKTGSSSSRFTFRAETEARDLSFYVRNDGYCLQALKTAAILDGSLDNSSFSFYFSSNDLIIKAKDSGGTVRTLNLGTLA